MDRYEVRITSLAESDLLEIIAYYKNVNVNYTKELYKKIKENYRERKTRYRNTN